MATLFNLNSTLGAWLISLFFEVLLYGMGLLQSWLYFHWYHYDHWGIKTMVLILVFSETIQTIFFFVGMYGYLITHFGNFDHILDIGWSDTLQLVPAFFSGFVVQMYFAFCIYTLNRRAWYQPTLIVMLSILQLTAGVVQDVVSTELGNLTKLDKTKATTLLQGASTLACDVIITVCLVRELGGSRSHLSRQTNSILHQLIVNAVNRGALTALTATINLVLFLAFPGTFYFFFGLFLSSKLYMNSALATLNSRQHIRKKAGQPDDFVMGTINTAGNTFANSIPSSGGRPAGDSQRAVEVIIQTHSEFHVDGADQKEHKASFMDDMV